MCKWKLASGFCISRVFRLQAARERHFLMKNFYLKAIIQVKIFTVIQTLSSMDKILTS